MNTENLSSENETSNGILGAVSKRFLLAQLDKWIEQCEEQADIFRQNGMDNSEISSQAMAQAYWNVKQLIDVNIK